MGADKKIMNGLLSPDRGKRKGKPSNTENFQNVSNTLHSKPTKQTNKQNHKTLWPALSYSSKGSIGNRLLPSPSFNKATSILTASMLAKFRKPKHFHPCL
jgi:hypothetical protein